MSTYNKLLDIEDIITSIDTDTGANAAKLDLINTNLTTGSNLINAIDAIVNEVDVLNQDNTSQNGSLTTAIQNVNTSIGTGNTSLASIDTEITSTTANLDTLVAFHKKSNTSKTRTLLWSGTNELLAPGDYSATPQYAYIQNTSGETFYVTNVKIYVIGPAVSTWAYNDFFDTTATQKVRFGIGSNSSTVQLSAWEGRYNYEILPFYHSEHALSGSLNCVTFSFDTTFDIQNNEYMILRFSNNSSASTGNGFGASYTYEQAI